LGKFLERVIIMDIFEKIKKNRGALGQYQDFGHGYFAFPKLEGEIEPHMTFRGKITI